MGDAPKGYPRVRGSPAGESLAETSASLRWNARQKIRGLLETRSDFATTRDDARFTARLQGGRVLITPSSTGFERLVDLDEFVDGYLQFVANPALTTSEIGGRNASYVLALCRVLGR